MCQTHSYACTVSIHTIDKAQVSEDVMFSCWNEDPKKRPTFGTLQEALEKIEKEQTGYLNLQSFVDFSYVNICEARKVKEESII
ncbi:hypothetical protein pdam_00014274 [Pocillopora damicornis]|uniref:Serine-threonine/tyrosine-protein kinase catalytic domain-containing protein n=1 Tax=Pocillopora damicornis TaxID=46731 RepID=A0A3M6V492_POCDA|nr:hypothetical protein pdam_00014274 [Pocillopora damicornis]